MTTWAAIDQLPHQWEKWKELGGNYVEYRACGLFSFV
jgi:hypothetical protein